MQSTGTPYIHEKASFRPLHKVWQTLIDMVIELRKAQAATTMFGSQPEQRERVLRLYLK